MRRAFAGNLPDPVKAPLAEHRLPPAAAPFPKNLWKATSAPDKNPSFRRLLARSGHHRLPNGRNTWPR